ncbi:MAG: calcium-binding protein, partial [Sterolibacterium sp.]
MNTQIHDAFINAVLADASYIDGLKGRPDGDLVQALKGVLTETLAQYVVDHFSVIDQYTDGNVWGSGFSVTVFQDRASGQRYVAFRGTERLSALADVLTDANVVAVTGLAQGQVIPMVNWYLRAIAAPGVPVVQLNTSIHNDSAGRVVKDTFTGTGNGILLGSGPLVVTGHSLGGHLATVFARLFPDNIAHSNTFNGLGVGRLLPDSLLAQIENTLGLGQTSYPTASGQSNYYAEHGINVATNSLWLAQYGERIPLFNEEATTIPNHLMYKLTDALALYDALGTIDSQLSITDATRILDAASANAPASLESLLDALRTLCHTTNTLSTQIGDTDLSASRIDYQTKLSALRGLVEGDPMLRGRIVSLANTTSTELVALASSDLGYRYAFKALNPFAITGAPGLYDQFNVDGALDPYDSVSGTGQLTQEWLTDRAKLLQAVVASNTIDNPTTARVPEVTGIKTEYHYFTDNSEHILFADPIAGTNSLPTRVVAFADDSGRPLTGTDYLLGDHLYGGGGADTLLGEGGDDYLEGRAGNDQMFGGADNDTLVGGAGTDTLNGGAGTNVLKGGSEFDTYIASSGEGMQIITDFDGQGRVLLDGAQVTGGAKVGGNTYVSADRATTLSFVGDLDSGGTLMIGSNVRIENFKNYDLGIALEATTPPTTPPTYTFYYPSDDDTQNGEWPCGSDFNDFIQSAGRNRFSPNYELVLGLDGTTYWGKAGDDLFEGSYNSGDWFWGGAGDDTMYGGALGSQLTPEPSVSDTDYLYGGAGQDKIIGGKGADHIWGDMDGAFAQNIDGQISLDTKIAFGDIDFRGDAIPGKLVGLWTRLFHNTGFSDEHIFDSIRGALDYALGISPETNLDTLFDDSIDGCEGDDQIFGGNGSDTILGGPGSDVIDGDGGANFYRTFGSYAYLLGKPGDDYIDGGGGDDNLTDSWGGNDVIYGGEGNDSLTNSDRMYLGFWEDVSFSNLLDGGDGNDEIQSGNLSTGGYDLLYGGNGDDTITFSGDQSGAFVDGGDGDDTIDVATDTDAKETTVVIGGDGSDFIQALGNSVNIDGGAGDDEIFAYSLSSDVKGGAGHDVIYAGGNGRIDGGVGDDSIFVDPEGSSIAINQSDAAVDDFDQLFIVGSVADASEVYFRQVGQDLEMDFQLFEDLGSRISVENWFEHGNHGLDAISFEDGVTWTPSDV